jgi:hypothetical protein
VVVWEIDESRTGSPPGDLRQAFDKRQALDDVHGVAEREVAQGECGMTFVAPAGGDNGRHPYVDKRAQDSCDELLGAVLVRACRDAVSTEGAMPCRSRQSGRA